MISISPDKERVRSIISMVDLREKRINNDKKDEFSTLLIEDYYEIIKELATALINLIGYKTLSHKILFDYLSKEYGDFILSEIELMHDLRKIRNKVVYEGFFIRSEYLVRNEGAIKSIIVKLKKLISGKLK